MRAFLKEGHVDEYEGVHVNWIAGHTPQLHIWKDHVGGELLETIVLSDYTTEELHQLMEDKGFKKRSALAVDSEMRQ